MLRQIIAEIKAEILELEHEARRATESGHHEQAVIYNVAAMRFRVLLQKRGIAEPTSKLLEHVNKNELIVV